MRGNGFRGCFPLATSDKYLVTPTPGFPLGFILPLLAPRIPLACVSMNRHRMVLGAAIALLVASLGWHWLPEADSDTQANSNHHSTENRSLSPSQKASPTVLAKPAAKASETATPVVGHLKLQPAQPGVPSAIHAFRDWASRYLLAAPEQRQNLLKEGSKLADEHRTALGQMISSDPRAALENAVPMVVRQDLPSEIVSRLEKRVNSRGSLLTLGAVAPEGQAVLAALAPVSHKFIASGQPIETAERYTAYVYGDRNIRRTVNNARVSGVAVDGQLAVLDAPFRRLEVGERPDPTKQVIEVCPISGEETKIERKAADPLPPVKEEVVAVEDNVSIRYLCSGGAHSDLCSAVGR